MGSGRRSAQDGLVARLLIFWTHPSHLSIAEADAWARTELRKVTGLAAVDRAELTRVRSTSANFGCPHDWMLELHLADGAQAADCVETPVCAEWLGDLRLLGMRPAVVAVDGREAGG
jgi:hypothetical protein